MKQSNIAIPTSIPTDFPSIMALYSETKKQEEAAMAAVPAETGNNKSEVKKARQTRDVLNAWVLKLQGEIWHWTCPVHNPAGDYTLFIRNL